MRSDIVRIKQKSETLMPGKWAEVQLALTALLARGHLLVEDVPGMGKTTLVKLLARFFALDLKRVQFTNDLLPADVLGVSVYRQETREFEFRPGPIFAEVVLADELNRAPPKTQSALLQAMEERMVTIEGHNHVLPPLFTVMATQNPRGMLGTFPLPESQLDRFMLKFPMNGLSREAELALLANPLQREALDRLPPLFDSATLHRWQDEVTTLSTSPALLDYVLRLLEESRRRPEALGLSPRAGLDLVRAARAQAWMAQRSHVLPEDVQAIFPYVAGHRVGMPDLSSGQERQLALELMAAVPVV